MEKKKRMESKLIETLLNDFFNLNLVDYFELISNGLSHEQIFSELEAQKKKKCESSKEALKKDIKKLINRFLKIKITKIDIKIDENPINETYHIGKIKEINGSISYKIKNGETTFDFNVVIDDFVVPFNYNTKVEVL